MGHSPFFRALNSIVLFNKFPRSTANICNEMFSFLRSSSSYVDDMLFFQRKDLYILDFEQNTSITWNARLLFIFISLRLIKSGWCRK